MQQQWSEQELAECWSLNNDEQSLLSGLTGENRIGVAVYLKFFQNEGRFPYSHAEIPQVTIEYLATSLQLPSSHFNHYIPLSRSNKRHRAKIRGFLGFRPCNQGDLEDAEQQMIAMLIWIARWLFSRKHGNTVFCKYKWLKSNVSF